MQFAVEATSLFDLITKIDLTMCRKTLMSEMIKYVSIISFSILNFVVPTGLEPVVFPH